MQSVILLLMIGQCYARGMAVAHSSNSHHTHYTPTLAPPPPLPCQPATASVSFNIHRNNPCVSSCAVVVNREANTTQLCFAWSPNAFWDGDSCVCRCELLPDNNSTIANQCTLNDTMVITPYNSSDMQHYYLAPIQCGAWLGIKDSAWQSSWYQSECVAILENLLEDIPNVTTCDTHQYTQGCRFLDTNQHLVPRCRETNNTSPCGVMLPCPNRNPCGLGADITTNIALCNTSRLLALNVSATEDTCYNWSKTAFLLDGKCVASCGRFYETRCVVDGLSIPPCEISGGIISPAVCSVPMSLDSYAGIRNGFYGISRVINSQCLVTLNCTESCFEMEGFNVTFLPYDGSQQIPLCVGDARQICKIEIPCDTNNAGSLCSVTILGLSEAIYKSVDNCTWFQARDAIVVLLWCVSLGCSVIVDAPSSTWRLLQLLIWAALSCIWEIGLPVTIVFYAYYMNPPQYARLAQRP